MVNLNGTFAPIVTPFTDDGMAVSEIRLARMVRWLLHAGVQGLVVGSDTGEFTTLSFSERKSTLEWTLREAKGGCRVLANVSSLSTAASLDLAQHAGRHGAHAAVLMLPYYGEYTEDETFSFVQTVSAYAKLPIILVDRFQAITPELKTRLAFTHSLVSADPFGTAQPRTDEFVVDDLRVNPLYTIQPHEETINPALAQLIRVAGRAKVVKAGLELHNVDVGPPRGPLKRLVGEPLALLEQILRPSVSRLEA